MDSEGKSAEVPHETSLITCGSAISTYRFCLNTASLRTGTQKGHHHVPFENPEGEGWIHDQITTMATTPRCPPRYPTCRGCARPYNRVNDV